MEGQKYSRFGLLSLRFEAVEVCEGRLVKELVDQLVLGFESSQAVFNRRLPVLVDISVDLAMKEQQLSSRARCIVIATVGLEGLG